jgi:hypothetical protein
METLDFDSRYFGTLNAAQRGGGNVQVTERFIEDVPKDG